MADTLTKLRLPRLPVGWQSQPQLFERYWDDAMSKLESTLNAILQIPQLDAAIQAAKEAAENANEAAGSAQATSAAQAKEQSLVNSYVTGFTGALLSASVDGTITISNHQRVYGDPTLDPTVSVSGGSLSTGKPAGSIIRVYYDDPTRSGGVVSYGYTTDPEDPPVQTGNRHSVGVATVPAAGSPPEEGDYIKPPGYVSRRINSQIE